MATVPTARAALRACVQPLLAYAITIAASLAVMVLVVIAIAVGSGGGDDGGPSEELDIKAIGTLVGMPFQLAAMSLGGSLKLGDADFSLSLYAPPLLLTALFAFVVFRLSKRAEKATPSGSTTERALLAVGGALATAVVAMVATRVLAMREDDTAMHAASVGLFFGVLTLAGVTGLLGRLAAHGSLWPRGLPADGRRAAHLVTQHVLVWVVVAIPIAVVWLMVDSGVETGLYALVWGPTVSLASFGLGHFGAVTVLGQHELAWDLGWFPGLVLPLLAVLFTVVAAVAWHLRRGNDRALLANPASWASLPVAYGGAALVVCMASTVGLSGELFGQGAGITFHVAYWLIPVLAVWGAVVEVGSRFVAPTLVGAVPEPVARRLGKGPDVLVSPPAGPTQRIPMSPTDKARAKKALVGAAIVGGLGLVGLIVFSIVGSTMYSPEKQAEDYLDALVDADTETALELAPVDDDEASDALMTSEVYHAADDRITGYEITDIDTKGDTTTVTVDLEGVDDGDDVEFRMSADGRRAGLFKDWKVDDGGLAREVTVSMPEGSTTLEVNGVIVSAESEQDSDFWALPGSYSFNPYGDNQWLEADDTKTLVPAEETWGIYAETAEPQPADELKQVVDEELSAWVNGCMESTEMDPDNCPQEAYGSGDENRNVSWTLTSMPTISWDGFYGTFPVLLSTDDEGEASVNYEYDESYGYGKPEWTTETETSDLYFNVEVDLVNGEPLVTFEDY